MGMPKTKAECDKAIARAEGEIARTKALLAEAKRGKNGYNTGSLENIIAEKKAFIAELKAHRKTLK